MRHPCLPSADAACAHVPSNCRPCRHGQACRRSNCTYAHGQTSLIKILQFLGAARASLEVCVFSITCDELADALIAAHSEWRLLPSLGARSCQHATQRASEGCLPVP